MNRLTIGALARQTGISVRMLRHYDEIGLLRPQGRSNAGYRLYGVEEVRRLQAIVALRQLGLSLAEIGKVLDSGGVRAKDAIELRLARLDDEIAERRRLQGRLQELVRRMQLPQGGTLDELVETVEVMNAMDRVEQYFTPEQLAELSRRREEIGETAIRQAEADWETLLAEVRGLVADGVPPEDPRARAAGVKWLEYVQAFTGGDPEIARSLQRLVLNEPTVGPNDMNEIRALSEYMAKARAAG